MNRDRHEMNGMPITNGSSNSRHHSPLHDSVVCVTEEGLHDRTTNSNNITQGDYDAHHHRTPFLIGVAGGTASGKTSVCKKIVEQLGQDSAQPDEQRVVVINQDAFYRRLNEKEHKAAEVGLFNFDHPDAFDDELLYRTMLDILDGKTVQIPTYDYVTHTRRDDATRTVYPADVVLVEGILVFYFPLIRNLFHMKLFVDTDADIRLSRRVLRDIKERGRDLSGVIHQYITTVKPAFEDFCLPTKKYADVIIPRGADNEVALALLLQYIKQILSRMRLNRRRLDSGQAAVESPLCGSLESESFLRRDSSLSRLCSVIHPQANHS